MEHDFQPKEVRTHMKPKRNFWGIPGIVLSFFRTIRNERLGGFILCLELCSGWALK